MEENVSGCFFLNTVWNINIAAVCVAWRKALRRARNLPINTHSCFRFELSHICYSSVFNV